MVICTKTGNNSYTLEGLTLGDLEMIQVGIASQFNQANQEEHRSFRTQVLRLNRPIESELEKLAYKKF
ncbi:hypothetical protein OU798_07620 [Prolixibacteraceae bacterium Z1-6]|uniref:Uncharacterized protein n=1 Tax=Draconibacterium aestuarii TaxID=2998507 RepID=A0A9X3F7B9_9BACT|nr:hypothetical protein [Prolixibacteraceae bacterium Z1-6]